MGRFIRKFKIMKVKARTGHMREREQWKRNKDESDSVECAGEESSHQCHPAYETPNSFPLVIDYGNTCNFHHRSIIIAHIFQELTVSQVLSHFIHVSHSKRQVYQCYFIEVSEPKEINQPVHDHITHKWRNRNEIFVSLVLERMS